MSINSVNYPVNYPGFYAPVFVENHLNPEATAIMKQVSDEIKVRQVEQKVIAIQETLKGDDLTQVQRNALEAMLLDAQREWAQVKRQHNIG